MLVYRPIGSAMLIEREPDQERQLNRSCVVSDGVKGWDSMANQFQPGGG